MMNDAMTRAMAYARYYTEKPERVGPAIGFRRPLVEKGKALTGSDEPHGARIEPRNCGPLRHGKTCQMQARAKKPQDTKRGALSLENARPALAVM